MSDDLLNILVSRYLIIHLTLHGITYNLYAKPMKNSVFKLLQCCKYQMVNRLPLNGLGF